MQRIGQILFLMLVAAASCQNAYGRSAGSHSSGSYRSASHQSDHYHGRSSSADSAYHGYHASGSHRDATRYSDGAVGVQRNSHGRIKRSEEAKRQFERATGYPHGRPGYVIDHIVPLKRGGSDTPDNMQWQTTEAAKQKDKTE
jgi:hypothetical protein